MLVLLVGVGWYAGGAVELSHATNAQPIAIAERTFLIIGTPKEYVEPVLKIYIKTENRKITMKVSFVYA